jgi:hypothetical protein
MDAEKFRADGVFTFFGKKRRSVEKSWQLRSSMGTLVIGALFVRTFWVIQWGVRFAASKSHANVG